jgi:hypothetical protein
MSIRTYRHLPWLGWCTFFLVAFGAGGVAAIVSMVREPAVDTITKGLFGLMLVVLFGAFPAGSFRIRTVVDDEAVTQHWITRSYRIPLNEITGLELDDGVQRWFLRVRQGEKTFEIIPCMVIFRPHGLLFPRPPRALFAVEADLTERLARRGEQPGRAV